MDNSHPIPQDITGFQFKLIGEMTIKQFAYIAAGVVFGWTFLLLPLFLIVKLPIAILIAICGFILAFVPVQGRPADIMLGLFLKALIHPTQYTKKSATQPTTTVGEQPVDTSTTHQVTHVSQTPETVLLVQNPQITHHEEPSLPIEQPQLSPILSPVQVPPPQSNPEDHQSLAETERSESQDTNKITEELHKAEQEEQKAPAGTAEAQEAHTKVMSLETQLQEAMNQKQQLEEELIALKKQMTAPKEEVKQPSPAVSTHVKSISNDMKATTGAPFVPDVPNLIAGVIKDPRGNVLPNILIEVKDRDGNPVRAFKTNQLGQFASATPLVNGDYTVTFEDPKKEQAFDAVELNVNGGIIPPFEIISVDEREELRKSLFGGST